MCLPFHLFSLLVLLLLTCLHLKSLSNTSDECPIYGGKTKNKNLKGFIKSEFKGSLFHISFLNIRFKNILRLLWIPVEPYEFKGSFFWEGEFHDWLFVVLVMLDRVYIDNLRFHLLKITIKPVGKHWLLKKTSILTQNMSEETREEG